MKRISTLPRNTTPLFIWHGRVHGSQQCLRSNPTVRTVQQISVDELDYLRLSRLCQQQLCSDRWDAIGVSEFAIEKVNSADAALSAGDSSPEDPALLWLHRQRDVAASRLVSLGILSGQHRVQVNHGEVLHRLYLQRCDEYGAEPLTVDQLWDQWVSDRQRELFERAASYGEYAHVQVWFTPSVWPTNGNTSFLRLAGDILTGPTPRNPKSGDIFLPSEALHDAVVRPNLGGLMMFSGLDPFTCETTLPLQLSLLLLSRGIYPQLTHPAIQHPLLRITISPTGPFGTVLQSLGLPMVNCYRSTASSEQPIVPFSTRVAEVAEIWESASAAVA